MKWTLKRKRNIMKINNKPKNEWVLTKSLHMPFRRRKKKKESGWNLQTNKKKGKSWGNMEKLLQELKTKANFINWLIKKM